MRLMVLALLVPLVSSCSMLQLSDKRWQVNRSLYKKANAAETEVKISLYDQQAWLLDGEGRVLLKTEVSTGVPGKETPQGEFTVLERLESKRSNRYGKYVNKTSGKVLVEKSWLHEGAPPAGTEYQGIDMPYWMRLTWWGVGMHVGKFPSHTRASFGCVRVYEEAQPLIFQKTQIGTRVTVSSESLSEVMFSKEKFSWL